jgi:hypothetical protein
MSAERRITKKQVQLLAHVYWYSKINRIPPHGKRNRRVPSDTGAIRPPDDPYTLGERRSEPSARDPANDPGAPTATGDSEHQMSAGLELPSSGRGDSNGYVTAPRIPRRPRDHHVSSWVGAVGAVDPSPFERRVSAPPGPRSSCRGGHRLLGPTQAPPSSRTDLIRGRSAMGSGRQGYGRRCTPRAADARDEMKPDGATGGQVRRWGPGVFAPGNSRGVALLSPSPRDD